MNERSPFERLPDDASGATEGVGATASPSAPAEAHAAPAHDPGHHDLMADEHVAPAAGPRRRSRVAALSIAAAVIFTAGAGGGAWASIALAPDSTTTASLGTGATTGQGTQGGFGAQGGTGTQGGTSGGQQFGGQGFGPGGSGSGSTGSGSSATSTTAATASQITGIVTIVSQLGYESGESAGSGIILTSSGRILTNNHVIDGATSIEVTVESTGKSYTADVVGTNATKDIAVLQLEGASGLTTADLASDAAAANDPITAVGNANGTGTLSAADGTVTAVDQTITTQSEGSTTGETLKGLIELDADVVSGDSGGAVKNADGEVVGVTTAASSGTANVTGYAIPIATATSIADQIVAGDDTDEITLGLPAFLGVSIASDSSSTAGAVIGQIIDGTPAASTGLAAGDAITAVDGTAIASGSALSAAIAAHAPGDSVRIAYTDASGADHTATVVLTKGPAD